MAEIEELVAMAPKKGGKKNAEAAAENAEAAAENAEAAADKEDLLVLRLMREVEALRAQLAAAPAEPAAASASSWGSERGKRPHIMVMVNPYNTVRVEVPEGYDGPGADGKVVKGYQNHAQSQLRR